MRNKAKDKIRFNHQIGGGAKQKRASLLFITIIFFLSLLIIPSLVQAATITANVTETNINSTVLLTGAGFSASTNYYLIPLLENKTAWWDGYNENWFFSTERENKTINITTDGSGNFDYNLYIPNDWRVSGGKISFKIGEQVASSLLWSTQGTNWAATQPTKNGVTGDSDTDGFIYAASVASAINTGGVEKFYKSNGTLACKYNWPAAVTPYDITNNGSIAYVVTSATSSNLRRIKMSDCTLDGTSTTQALASYSVNVAPDNSYLIITYAASATIGPKKYMINAGAPAINNTFAPTAINSLSRDSCISPDGTIVYVGYDNGNITALDANTGATIWNSDPPEEEIGDGYNFPVYSLGCDNEKVYVARSLIVYPTGITEQGFVEALWATNGSRAWMNSKTDTIYDGQNVQEIKCKDTNYCYAIKTTTPAPYVGVLGSTIFQIDKSNGNVIWWNWRSYLPTTYNGFYGEGGTHSIATGLWADPDDNGYIYPTYSNGWVQKITKNDVNASIIETNLWIRGLTNFWNYIADVPKNIWLSNETPYYNFRHWNQQGMPLNTTISNLVGTFFRYSMLNSFNEFTAYEYYVSTGTIWGASAFINPVIQIVPTQRNEVQYFDDAYHPSCPNTRYSTGLYGWHYQDRACFYEEIPATLAGYNIGTTINGTYIPNTIVYSLIKTKFWEYYPITKYYGNDNWAWASWHNTTNDQVLGFATKFGNDQEDVYSDIFGRAVLFANNGTTRYYRPQFRADLNRKTDNYIFFMPKGGGGNGNGDYMWSRIDIETQKVASPVNITLSTDESGTFSISGDGYGNRIQFTAQEPNLFNRDNEPVEIIFNAVGGIRTDCQDVIITDETDTLISLWQVDNSTSCSQNNNVSVWIMMDWTQNEIKNLRLYYNSPLATPFASGTTDLIVTTVSGSCATNNHEVNITSANWYNWQRPAAATASNEKTRFIFNNTANLWVSTTHYQIAQNYKNSNTTGTGAGSATDAVSTVASIDSRCLQTGGTGKIFAKTLATNDTSFGIISGRPTPQGITVEYYFFANTGRVRIRTQLNQSLPTISTTVSKNWPPYYYFSIANFIPPSGADSWIYYSGLYEQMKKPVAVFNADQTEANLSSSPLPLMFTIKYNGIENLTQTNGSIYRPSTLTDNFGGEGCTANKEWQYYSYSGGSSYGTAAVPLYTSEFISCSKNISSSLPVLGSGGYVNVFPEVAWWGTTTNKWYDPILIGKFYMQSNLWRPYNRENRFLSPYATSNPYTTARISTYIIPRCPEKEYGYKGYDDFLADLPNMIANKSLLITTNTENIPCATQLKKWTDARGADGQEMIFARNLTVIVSEVFSAGLTYPYNTYAPGTYSLQLDGELDLTFAQKASTTAGYYGKWYFTYTPYDYVIHAFSTSGNPQFSGYSTRYNFAPESPYNKNVFDESALWDKESQNFTYYRNPCWLGRYTNIYGSTETGHPALATLSTPGWQNNLLSGNVCPKNTYNMETQDVFRPGWSSIYPTVNPSAVWRETVIDGRENFAGTGTPPGAEDTYAIDRHNSLWDYKHNDDFNSVWDDINDLNQDEKHPNKQPWYCQISRHTNKSFCVMTSSMSSLIYNYAPGGGLTISTPWSAYWSSVREMSVFRNYFVPRFNNTSPWLFTYDNALEVKTYPTLASTQILSANLLYTSNNADEYESFFGEQFPFAFNTLYQNQFLLRDWKNSAFMYLDLDSRQYAPGQAIKTRGLFIRNGNIFNNTNIVLQIYKNDGTHIKTYQTSTDANGLFSWDYTLPTTVTSGLYYVYLDYNNEEFTDSVSFVITTYNVVTTTNKLSYVQGEPVPITHTITDYISGEAIDPVTIQEEIIDALGTTIKCSRYPSTIPTCENLLTKSGIGSYSSRVILDESLPSGDATIKVTTTDSNGVNSYYYGGFGIGKTAGTITVSLQNTIVGTSFTSNVTTTNTGYEQASKTVEVTVPTSCGYITGVTNSTEGSVSYNTQDLSSACKVYWTVTLSGKATTGFLVQATLQSSSGANPGIEIDTPSVINTNTNFGIATFVRNTNSQLVNCDSLPLLNLKDNLNGSVILNDVSMTNSATGKYNYTTSLSYQSTFLTEVTCAIGGTTYTSNPKIISSQNVPTNDTGGTGGSAYPTIELSASTPIATSTLASIGALVKSSTGTPVNCDGNLGITIKNLADSSSTSGIMTSLGTGMYNYSWTTPATASVFYINASCSISGIAYTGFTMISTQNVGANVSVDYNQIAAYVWNYTSRNLTYYNQSVAESIQNCLKDGVCSGWWLNTTLTNIHDTINTINTTVNQIKTNTETILSYFNCTSANEVCTRLQSILNNATDIQSRVYSLNTSQIPYIKDRVDLIYTDTQYIRINMATDSALQDVNSSIWWIRNNLVTQEMFNANITEIRNRLSEINSTTQEITAMVDCSNPSNSAMCTYLRNINATTNSIYSEMATYEQCSNILNNVTWIKDNVATQEAMANNFTDIKNRLTDMNTTLGDIHDDLAAVNTSLSNQITNVQTNITWIINNVATSAEMANNFTETFNRLTQINTTVSDTNAYLYNDITTRLTEINTTTQNTYSYILANVSTQANLTEILSQINNVQDNLTFVKNNMFYQGNATGAFLVDYLATVYAEKNSRAELWILTKDLLGNAKTVSAANCSIVQKGVYIATQNVSISSGRVYAYWDIPLNQGSGEYYWECELTGSTLNLYVPFFVSSTTSNFWITSLVSASPKYPNENAIVEATFAGQNGSIEPDSINMTIWKPNYLTIWYTANKADFSRNGNIWYWTQMIESSPTTGTYYVQMAASYNGMTDSRTTQFRIATGGPYKVYLECPTSSNVGSNLVCSVIIQDEGEAATESTTSIWVDTNGNSIVDAGEPQTSFSKETQPMQNVIEAATINVPSTHATGSFVVRASTKYLNSGQPDSTASDSVTFQTSGTGGDTGGGTGGSSGGGSSGGSGTTPRFDADFTTKSTVTFDAVQGSSKTFTFDGTVNTIHHIKIESVSGTRVTFVISSDPITITMNVGEIRDVDINKDGLKDIKINLKKINNGIVEYSIEKLGAGVAAITGQTIIRPEHIMDVTVNILGDYKVVGHDSKLLAEITFYNFGTEEIKDARVTYCIKKESGENVKCKQETVAVYTKIQFVKEFLISEDMDDGRYDLVVEVKYGNETAIGQGTFLLISKAKTSEQKAEFLNITINKFYLVIGAISLACIVLLIIIIIVIFKMGALGLLIFIHRQKIKAGIEVIKEKGRKKYPSNSIRGLVNKKVYSESGHYIGKVIDIILGENRIDSLKIQIDKKHKFKAKGIIVDYRQVKSVSEIVIIDKNVLESIASLRD